MRGAVYLMAAAGLLSAAATARAQPGPTPGQPQAGPGAAPAPGWQPWQPRVLGVGQPSPTPSTSVPQTPAGIASVGAPACGTAKVCVMEPKPTTKVVYGSICQDYCVARCCSLFGLLRHGAGFGDECGSGGCGDCELRTRRVLVKKVVPDCDKPTCVLKDAPAGSACCLPVPVVTAPVVLPPSQVVPYPVPPLPPTTATPYR